MGRAGAGWPQAVVKVEAQRRQDRALCMSGAGGSRASRPRGAQASAWNRRKRGRAFWAFPVIRKGPVGLGRGHHDLILRRDRWGHM